MAGKSGARLVLYVVVACALGCRGARVTGSLETRRDALSSSFTIRLPAGVFPPQVVFGAAQTLNIADNVKVLEPSQQHASIANVGSVSTELGVQGEVQNVWSTSNVFLRDRSHVFCSVDTAGSLTEQNQVLVDGAIEQGIDLGVRTAASWTVSFPTPGRSIMLEPGQTATLTPGSYGSLDAKSRTTVTLNGSGVYYFQSFFIEPQATLVVRNANGPVYVFVAGTTFTWRGTMQKQNTSLFNVLFGYLGTADAVIDAPFVGTVVAPNANVNLISTSAGYTGSFFALSINTAQPQSPFTHQPFNAGNCSANATACAIGLGCADLNGNDVPDCAECPSGVAGPEPPPTPGFTWTTPDVTAPHVAGIAPEGNRLELAPLVNHTIGASVEFPPRSNPLRQVCLGDFDDSGFADIAYLEGDCTSLKWIRRVNSAPALYALDTPLHISDDPVLRTAKFLSCADVDGDGFDDVVVTTTPGGNTSSFNFLVLENNGNGTHFAPTSTSTTYQNVTIIDQAMADFDSDGFADLVLALRHNDGCGDTLELFANTHQPATPYGAAATASLGLGQLVPRHTFVQAVTAGDFDGDCVPDLWLLAGGDLFFLKGAGNFSFAAPVLVQHFSNLKVGVDIEHLDVDSDGKQDLLLSSGGSLAWYQGLGNGQVSGTAATTVPWGKRIAVSQRGCVR